MLYFMTVWVNEILRRLFICPGSAIIQRGRNICLPSGITVNGINPCHKKAESTQHNGQGAETIIYDAGRKTFFCLLFPWAVPVRFPRLCIPGRMQKRFLLKIFIKNKTLRFQPVSDKYKGRHRKKEKTWIHRFRKRLGN